MGMREFIVGQDDPILITGATGFIGSRLVANLLERGFRNLRCFARPSSAAARVHSLSESAGMANVEVITGNLLSREDCIIATRDAALIFHLAAGRGEKSFPDAFMNSVITTRNLLEASLQHKCLRRFVNISSFAVYTNARKPHGRMLDESCPVETQPVTRGDAYCFAKVRQDEIVTEYSKQFGIPCVMVRPGVVYGPGNEAIHPRVGIGTFGPFLHLGGSNVIPFTYVENCADAIAQVGLTKGTDGQVFNVVDDDLPSSRRFLRLYKKNVERFKSIYVPHILSYAFCYAWERYSVWSIGQLPPVFNRKRWHANWSKTRYSNAKLKGIGWKAKVSTAEGLANYFEACRNWRQNA